MTFKEYVSQREFYFSESAQEQVPLTEMPIPHMAHAFKKLAEQHGSEFWWTPLCCEMLTYLRPPLSVLVHLLRTHGKASFMLVAPGEKKAARARFYRAQKILGTRVAISLKGNLMQGEIAKPEVTIKVKGKELVWVQG